MKPNRRALACLAVTLLSPALQAQTTGQTVRHHREAVAEESQSAELTQAEAAIEKKDYAAAEALLKQAVEKNAANYLAWFYLGFVYNAQHMPDEAIAAYRSSVTAKPEIFESNLNLGLMLARKGDAEAEKFLRAATRLTPTAHVEEGRERAWLSLAHVLEAKDPDAALQAYGEAAALQPKDPEPHISAGLMLERHNQLDAAEKEYRQVLALDPESQDAAAALTSIYIRGKRFSEAETTLRALAAKRPDDAELHLQLGRVLAESGKNDEAASEFQAGLKITPNDRNAQQALAGLLNSAGKYTESEPLLRTLLQSNPGDAELHAALGQSLLHQKKFSEAQQEYLEAVKLKPDWGEVYGELATAASENKNYPLAIRSLDQRARFLPEMPGTYFLRATAYDNLRDYKQAAANYHSFLGTAKGKYPDQEWQARHRLIAIEKKR